MTAMIPFEIFKSVEICVYVHRLLFEKLNIYKDNVHHCMYMYQRLFFLYTTGRLGKYLKLQSTSGTRYHTYDFQ